MDLGKAAVRPSSLVASHVMVLSGLCDLVSFGVDLEPAVGAELRAGLLVALDVALVVRSDTCSGIRLHLHPVAQPHRILLIAVLEPAQRRLSFGLGALPQTLL